MRELRTRSYNEVTSMHRYGLISDKEFRLYRLEWEWTAFRHTPRHDRAYMLLGRELYWKRINRARKRCGFPECDLNALLSVA